MREAPAKLHFALIPLMSQGHMIPMLDIARLLAERGATVTYITTPINAARINRVSGLPIRFAELPFPAAAASLPEGCENVDLVPSKELLIPFFSRALSLFREVVEDYLRQGQLLNLLPSPSCIIADSCITWAGPVARSIGARHLVFHGPSCFSLLCSMLIDRHKVLQTVADDLEHFVVPELPYKIVVNRAQAPGWFNTLGLEKMRQEIFAGEAAADGVVLNSCEELELYFIEKYREAMGKKIAVWPIGPLSLCNKDFDSKAARGNPAAIDVELLLSWLDAKVAGSVVFVSFGSISRTPPRQLMEVGCGLETSGYPFVWVVKESGSFSCPEVERWMKEFEQRTTKEQRGLIVKGWAPQVKIVLLISLRTSFHSQHQIIN
ncbi:UDP-glycosyltransferase 73C3 [Apostasia shenzhenica]|uniref:UDP-glycosyltransferase 73C3 n=1 Tax=Apostasia shenzhenica TaxID=1088818 RepID=A0A2I0B9T0_9ASPA|nr:UDP-glycosyltransferase 73C3 [Apostasia shenzhenica]